MIRLDKFDKDFYSELISWIDTAEELMQFAGPAFIFPLTEAQLEISQSDKNRHSFRVVNDLTNLAIGHSEIYVTENSAWLSRIIIANINYRGKGIGQQIVRLLLDSAFFNLGKEKVELNVFDWNIAAIKCYEKVGFSINSNKSKERMVNDKIWTAINMSIDKKKWKEITANCIM